MSSLRSGPAGAGLVLVVRTRQSDHRLQRAASYRLGRDPGSDIVLSDTRVSWHHATLRHEQGNWILEDVGSTNGTFTGAQRVNRVTISSDCVIRLGNPKDAQVLRCGPVVRPVDAPTEISTPVAGSGPFGDDRPGPIGRGPIGHDLIGHGAVEAPPPSRRAPPAYPARAARTLTAAAPPAPPPPAAPGPLGSAGPANDGSGRGTPGSAGRATRGRRRPAGEFSRTTTG